MDVQLCVLVCKRAFVSESVRIGWCVEVWMVLCVYACVRMSACEGCERERADTQKRKRRGGG